MTVVVRPTHEMGEAELSASLFFCRSGSKEDAHAVGWIPAAAYRGATLQRRLLICYNNDDRVGYCLWKQRYDEICIYQIWVRNDARLILHGRALCDFLDNMPLERPARHVRLWCAEDLAANIFWKALGFNYHGWRHGPKRTSKRKHFLWIRPIVTCPASLLAAPTHELSAGRPSSTPPIPCPLHNAAARTVWPSRLAARGQAMLASPPAQLLLPAP